MNTGSKHKMYDYAVTPPERVWEKISADLDAPVTAEGFPARLYAMEVVPAAGIWDRIVSDLETTPVKALPSRKRVIPVLRYAAAAAILAFLVWGGIRLSDNSKQGEVVKKMDVQPTILPAPPEETRIVTPSDAIVSSKDPAILDEARNDAALEASKKTYAKHVPARSKIKKAAGFHFSLDKIDPISPAEMDPANRYIVLMTPDGNIIRVSKKLSDLVCCVSGEEQDTDCVDQMKKWRDKLAASSGTYSPGNFGDILNLVKSLQE